MIFVYLYRKLVPIMWRYRRANRKKNRQGKKLLEEIKQGKFADVFPEECKYILQKNYIITFPYPFTEKYNSNDVTVHYDRSCGMNYVIHLGKKLYFPEYYPADFIKLYYTSLIVEQDSESPHFYFDYDSDFINGATLYDVGAAEGIVSLSVIERVGKVYLFECDKGWIKALNKTFEPWKDKVFIFNKLVSNEQRKNTVCLDNYFEADDQLSILKLDVEGMEQAVLQGANLLLSSTNVRAYVCTYHKTNDIYELDAFLKEYGFNNESSKGYMIYGLETGRPEFRKGLLRAIK